MSGIRRGLHARLLATALVSVTLALTILVAAFNLLLGRQLDANAADQARARATAELAAVDTTGGTVNVGEAADAGVGDSPIWVFAGDRTVEEPRLAPRVNAAAGALAASGLRSAEVPGADVRLEAVPIVQDGRRIGTVIAGVSLKPYENAKRTALVASLVLSALLLAVVAAVTRRLLNQALRPVSTMAASARAWSANELDRRFGLGPPTDELTELAATLDALLDRIADSLRREQRLTAEISHELRTPLARLLTQAELALRREREPGEYRTALAAVARNAQAMARIVDALLDAARLEAGARRGSADPNAVARQVAEACRELAAGRGVDIELVEAAGSLHLGIDDELAARTLQPIVENACRYARSKVTLTVTAPDGSGQAEFDVRDDGAGVADEDRALIFEPRARGRTGGGSPDGTGLGLALARRLAESSGGEVELADGPASAFRLRLPLRTGAS